ncbi:unnamed protein product, partial [Choristocarpus tenellus]
MPSSVVTPLAQPLVVVSALGKSLGTLLGPTESSKCIHIEGEGRGTTVTISSNSLALLRSMDVVHPVGTLVLEALEGMESGFGSGVTTMVTLLGALCTEQ